MSNRFSSRWAYISIIVLLAVGLRVLGPQAKHTRPADLPDGQSFTAVVEKIYDGDSFLTSRGEVRLLCIDTPEYGEPLSDAAAARLKELIGGKNIRFVFDTDKRDDYGRMLCHAWSGDTWVNKQLVAEGLASVYLFEPNLSYAEKLIAAQKHARLQNIGIWSLPAPPPEKYYVRSKSSYRFHRPGCRFARNIASSNLEKFTTRGQALDVGLSPCRQCKP